MSRFDYQASRQLEAQDPPFYALIMAAMRRADTDNARLLRVAFPDTWAELDARYNAPGGYLSGEEPAEPIVKHCERQTVHDPHVWLDTDEDRLFRCGGVS